jgi:hypothetical protein
MRLEGESVPQAFCSVCRVALRAISLHSMLFFLNFLQQVGKHLMAVGAVAMAGQGQHAATQGNPQQCGWKVRVCRNAPAAASASYRWL